jgi:hypothetical protein
MVSDRGGYPDLTAMHLKFHVPHEMTTRIGRTYSPEEMAVSAIRRRFLAANLVLLRYRDRLGWSIHLRDGEDEGAPFFRMT